MKKLLLPTLLAGFLLSSCSDDDDTVNLTTELTPVKFSATLVDMSQTRALKSTWSEGDQLAIFSDVGIKKNGSTSTSAIIYTRSATTGVWNSPSADEQWYFSDAIRMHNFYTYFPIGTATSYTAVEIPNIYGQDGTKTVTALKEENDFLRGGASATRDMLMADFQLFRVYAIINLNVKIKQDAFMNNAATLTDVKFTSSTNQALVNSTTSEKATVNLSNGIIACPTGLKSVTLHPTGGFALTPTEISIPIKIFHHQGAIQVQFTIGGKSSVSQALSVSNFVGGHVYNFSVEIGSELEQVGIGDPIIFDWMSSNGTAIGPIIPN